MDHAPSDYGNLLPGSTEFVNDNEVAFEYNHGPSELALITTRMMRERWQRHEPVHTTEGHQDHKELGSTADDRGNQPGDALIHADPNKSSLAHLPGHRSTVR